MESLLLAMLILGFGLGYYTHAFPSSALQAAGDMRDRALFIAPILLMMVMLAARIVEAIAG